jgi:uncharacterized protein YegJ (DUF2314 family)
MKTQILTIILILGLASCNSKHTTKIERKGEPTVYGVQDSDVEMNEAIEKANQTLDNFKRALKSNNKDFKYFALKVRFITPQGGEHIWLSSISLKNKKYIGVVDNLPESTTEVKIGDTIQIKTDDISDWMYVDGNKLHGGYTLRVLRNRMTDAERKKFDKNNNITIED